MEEAVQEVRGEKVRADVEPEIQLGFPAYIPDSYVADERQRLAFYRRLAAATNRAELDDLALEMRERYGPVPPLVDSFLRVMDLRRRLKAAMVVRARQSGDTVSLQFHSEAPVDVEQLVAMVERSRGRFRLSADFQISFTAQSKDWDGLVAEIESVLERLHGLPRSGNKAAEEETVANVAR
jgi:transcription-repair coupling factor (superfamily II helicase)